MLVVSNQNGWKKCKLSAEVESEAVITYRATDDGISVLKKTQVGEVVQHLTDQAPVYEAAAVGPLAGRRQELDIETIPCPANLGDVLPQLFTSPNIASKAESHFSKGIQIVLSAAV